VEFIDRQIVNKKNIKEGDDTIQYYEKEG